MLDRLFKTIEKMTPTKWRWILNHEGFKRYFANTSWMFLGQMSLLLVSFFIGAWIARYLGPEQYGSVSYVVAFSGLFAFIANLGVDGILNRELIAHPEQRDDLMGTAFVLKIIGGLLAFTAVVIASFLFISSIPTRLLIILYSFIFIIQAVNVIVIFFQANVLSKNSIKSVLAATTISTILKVIMIFSGSGIFWLILIYVLDAIWQSIGYLLAYRRYKLKVRNWRFDKKLAVNIIGSSWFLMLSSASVYIYMRIDQVMIGNFIGEKAVGIYSAAVKFVEIWNFIPSIICASLFPAIINAKNKDNLLYRKRLKALYLLMAALAVFIAIFSTIAAPFVINSFFGPEYVNSVTILRIYVWSGVGLFLSLAINQQLLSENYVNKIFYYNLFAMIVNVFLNIILIPRIGLNGAAWATFFSYSVSPLIFFIINRKNGDLDIRNITN